MKGLDKQDSSPSKAADKAPSSSNNNYENYNNEPMSISLPAAVLKQQQNELITDTKNDAPKTSFRRASDGLCSFEPPSSANRMAPAVVDCDIEDCMDDPSNSHSSAMNRKQGECEEKEDYPAFKKSTHAWVIYGGKYSSTITNPDRLVGAAIVFLQLAVYIFICISTFEDFKKDAVPVKVNHGTCDYYDGSVLEESLECEANQPNKAGLFLALFMVALFLSQEFQDAYVVIFETEGFLPKLFAMLVFLEVFSALITCVFAATQKGYVGDTAAALEVGVGLLFVHDIGGRVFVSIQSREDGNGRKYKRFLCTLLLVMVIVAVVSFASFYFLA